ncbi:MAG: hypothetical protein JSV88_11655, partial [Candidatus Aminicenantes bacterium]
MLKKEVKEVIKQSLVFIVIAAVMPIPVLLASGLLGSALSYGEVFSFVFHVGLLIFSVFMGTSLFSRDMGDGGLEYLLTLPYSRLHLLGMKLVPRFLALMAVFALYVLLLFITGMGPDTSKNVPLLATGTVFFMCTSLFIIAVPFSITRGSIVVSVLAALFTYMVYLGIIHVFYPTALLLKGREMYYTYSVFQSAWYIPGYIWFSAVALLPGSLLAFIYAFKRFDLGPNRGVIKRYLKVFIPIFIIIVVVSMVWAAWQIQTPKKLYYLTTNHQLVESGDRSAKIYDSTGVREIDMGGFYWTYFGIEKEHYIYTIHRSRSGSEVLRLHLRDPGYQVEEVYNVRGNASIHSRGLFMYKDAIAFFERRREDYQRIYYLVVLQPDTGTCKKTQVHGHTRVDIYPSVIGAGEMQGKGFWLVYFGPYRGWDVMRIWEDGHMERLGITAIRPVYVKGMLITGDGRSIIFNKVTPGGIEEIKKLPVEKRFVLYRGAERNLDQQPVKELYGGIRGDKYSQWKKVMALDLESLELREIKQLENSSGFFDYSHPGNWYYTELDRKERWIKSSLKKLYRMQQGRLELVKEFAPAAFDWRKDHFGIYKTGMVLRREGKITVYRLPGLEEIKFKKLK